MNDIIQREHISSYTIATLLHEWGMTPRVKNPNQVDFSCRGYQFSCAIEKETLLLHFGDVAFKELGQDIVLSETQAELGSIQKRIGQNFASLSAFRTKKNEVGIEFIAVVPIAPCVLVDHLYFFLKNFLSGSLKTLGILKNLGYRTLVNYILSDMPSTPITNQITPQKHKQVLCFSCEGVGRYSNGVQCSICHGSGENSGSAAKRREVNQWFNPDPAKKSSTSNHAAYGGCSDIDYGFDGYAEHNAMHDDNLSDYSAEMGHDGDDY